MAANRPHNPTGPGKPGQPDWTTGVPWQRPPRRRFSLRWQRPRLLFGTQPLTAILVSIVCWSVLAWILGPLLTPWVQFGADKCHHFLDGWMGSRLRDVTGAPSTVNTVGSGFIAWLVQIPLVMVLLAVYIVVGLLGIALELAERLHLLPFIGAYIGMLPGYHSAPFLALGRLLPNFVAYGSELTRARTHAQRAWAIAPFAIAGLVILGVWGLVLPRLQQQPWWKGPAPAAERVVRYSISSPTWRHGDAVTDRWRFELLEATLTRTELGFLVRVHNRKATSGRFFVDTPTALVTADGSQLSREAIKVLAPDTSTSLRVPPNGYQDVALRFTRPRAPYRSWKLWIYARDRRSGGTKVDLDFTLDKEPPGS
jgi:hypothetical protein